MTRSQPNPSPSTARQASGVAKDAFADQTVKAWQFVSSYRSVDASVSAGDVVRQFHDEPHLHSLPVLDDGRRVVGVIRVLKALRMGTEGFFRELLGRRSCVKIMETDPLIFDADTELQELSRVIADQRDHQLIDGFFVTRDGIYVGAGRISDLLRVVVEQQISAAREANPLTQLPGNARIESCINQNIRAGQPFAVVYFDLDNFKPYNDVYGYHAGDRMIVFVADVLRKICGSTDFLGHIGGDDFVMVFHSTDWEKRVRAALEEYRLGTLAMYDEAHAADSGYFAVNRQGQKVFHPLVGLSAGVVLATKGRFESAAELSPLLAEAKKLAKNSPRHHYFVDRRSR